MGIPRILVEGGGKNSQFEFAELALEAERKQRSAPCFLEFGDSYGVPGPFGRSPSQRSRAYSCCASRNSKCAHREPASNRNPAGAQCQRRGTPNEPQGAARDSRLRAGSMQFHLASKFR